MSMFSIFNVSGSAISAQAQRLNVVASNLANVDAVAGPDGQAYKARQVVFQTALMGSDASAGVRVNGINESQVPGQKILDPSNPNADAQGYVTHSNVNSVEEMVNMIETQRAYEINSKAISAVDGMLRFLNTNM